MGLLNEPRSPEERQTSDRVSALQAESEKWSNAIHQAEIKRAARVSRAGSDADAKAIDDAYAQAIDTLRAKQTAVDNELAALTKPRETVGEGESLMRGAVPGGAATMAFGKSMPFEPMGMKPSAHSPWGEPASPKPVDLQAERARQAQAAEDHPVLYGAGKVASTGAMTAMGIPAPVAVGGTTVADRLGAGEPVNQAVAHGAVDAIAAELFPRVLPPAASHTPGMPRSIPAGAESIPGGVGKVVGAGAIGAGQAAAHQALDGQGIDPGDMLFASGLAAAQALAAQLGRGASRGIRDQASVESGEIPKTDRALAMKTRDIEPELPPNLKGAGPYKAKALADAAGQTALRELERSSDALHGDMTAIEDKVLDSFPSNAPDPRRSEQVLAAVARLKGQGTMSTGDPRLVNEIPALDEIAARAQQPLTLRDLVEMRRDLDTMGKMGRVQGRPGAEFRQLSGDLATMIADEAPVLGEAYLKRHSQMTKLEEALDNLVATDDRNANTARAAVESRAASKVMQTGKDPVVDRQLREAEGNLQQNWSEAELPGKPETPELMSRVRRLHADNTLAFRGVKPIIRPSGISAYDSGLQSIDPLLSHVVDPGARAISAPQVMTPIMSASVAAREGSRKKKQPEQE